MSSGDKSMENQSGSTWAYVITKSRSNRRENASVAMAMITPEGVIDT